MAGRGRGKPSMSFNTEQLGMTKGELPAQVLQPPMAYPMLDLHISNFESTNELEYLVELKREFAEYMKDSAHNIQLDVQKKDIERYSDHYQDTIADNSDHEPKYDWSRMPKELTLLLNRKKATNNLKKKKNNKKITPGPKRKRLKIIDDDNENDNVQDTQVKLDQQKSKQVQGNMDKEIKEIKEEEEDEGNSEEEMEEYGEVDKEMDDGTDYVNNYFDNGEAFDDDEDNLDDGPVY